MRKFTSGDWALAMLVCFEAVFGAIAACVHTKFYGVPSWNEIGLATVLLVVAFTVYAWRNRNQRLVPTIQTRPSRKEAWK